MGAESYAPYQFMWWAIRLLSVWTVAALAAWPM